MSPAPPEFAGMTPPRGDGQEGEGACKPVAGCRLLLRVNSLAGSVCDVEADGEWTVQAAKAAVEAMAGIPARQQRLIAGATELRNEDKLETVLELADGVLDVTLLKRSAEQMRWLTKVKDSWTSLIEAPKEVRADREVVLAALQRNGHVLRYASEELRRDREVVAEAIKQDGCSLQWALKELRADRDLALEAVKHNGLALGHTANSLRGDKELVGAAVIQNFGALKFAAATLRADRDFILQVVRRNGKALRFADEALKDDREIVLAAIKSNSRAILYASKELQDDTEVQCEALRAPRD